MRELNVNDITNILPHRYPFLMVDRVSILEEGKKGRGIKNVSANENYFTGHFPGNPVMPGVLIVEAMAQTSGVIILSMPENKGKIPFFMSIEEAKFRKPVLPGDQLIMEIDILRFNGKVGKVKGQAFINNELAVEALMVFMVIQKDARIK